MWAKGLKSEVKIFDLFLDLWYSGAKKRVKNVKMVILPVFGTKK